MKPNPKERGLKIIASKRDAAYTFHLLQEYEAGIILTGTEIKSLRAGKVNLSDAYCAFEEDELHIRNLHIAPYEHAGLANHEAKRSRKLLLNKRELKKLKSKLQEKGLTIIPTVVYVNERGYAKIGIALAKGKKLYDKREDLKRKESKRELDRTLKDL